MSNIKPKGLSKEVSAERILSPLNHVALETMAPPDEKSNTFLLIITPDHDDCKPEITNYMKELNDGKAVLAISRGKRHFKCINNVLEKHLFDGKKESFVDFVMNLLFLSEFKKVLIVLVATPDDFPKTKFMAASLSEKLNNWKNHGVDLRDKTNSAMFFFKKRTRKRRRSNRLSRKRRH